MYVYFKSPSLADQITCYVYASSSYVEEGDKYNGTFESSCRFNMHIEAGVWHVHRVYLHDVNNNGRTYYNKDILAAINVTATALTVNVLNASATRAPTPVPPQPPTSTPAPTPAPTLPRTGCVDSSTYKDPAHGDTCSEWVGYICRGHSYSEQLISNCPRACGACTVAPKIKCEDSTTYKDPVHGYGCSGWSGHVCHGYSFSEELLGNCPRACAACTVAPLA